MVPSCAPCRYIEGHVRGNKLDFTQEDVDDFRHTLPLKLITGKL
jgi:hypothetical protein